MQRNFLAFALLGLAIISALATAWLCFQTDRAMAETKKVEERAVALQARAAQADVLFNEAIQYSKKNPAILTALRSAGITNLPAGAANRPNR